MKEEGFVRLSTDEVRENLVQAIRMVVLRGDRILLHQDGVDVAMIISMQELEKLDNLWDELNPSPFTPEDEEYYADEKGIHCLYPQEIEEDFDEIMQAVRFEGELFGLLPTENFEGLDLDIFEPVAVLMNTEKFWVEEHYLDSRLD